MSEIRGKVEESAGFYKTSFLEIDFRLADFSYRTLKPFFRGKLGLELGPALGYMTKHLVHDFRELHIVEGSLALLNEIPEYPNVVKHHALFEEFETPLRFDTIVMSHVLEHVSNVDEVLRRIYTWLAPNGAFLVAVPNAQSVHRLVAVEMGLISDEYALNQRDIELGHCRVYDLNSLQDDVKKAGFTVVEKGGYFLKPLSNSQIDSSWTSDMIEGFYNVSKYLPQFCAEIFVVCKK